MKNTIFNSKLYRITENGYREYRIELKKWAEFFGGQEIYDLLILDDSEDFTEENYQKTYDFLENEKEEVLKTLEEYSMKEYNYRRSVCLKNTRKSYLEDMLKLYPEILKKETAAKLFRLKKIQILPFKKDGEYYVIYDIQVIISEDESMKFENFKFSVILQKSKFIVAIDTNYNMEYLKLIITEDKNGQTLKHITSTKLDYGHYVLRLYDDLIEKTDFSGIRFRGRSIFGKYKELLPYASCLDLREMEARNSEYGLPPGSKIIGDIGQDGIFFFIVKRLGIKKEEAPIYVVSPMNFDCYIAPVARNLLEFISLGVAFRSFVILESISTSEKIDIEDLLTEEDHDPNIKELIPIIKQNFPIIPMKDPYDYVKEIQADKTLQAEAKKLEKYVLKKLGLDE